ncbi:MAG: cytochrome-c oxidase, cbb3-type subunit III [Pseudomonadota bacterium]
MNKEHNKTKNNLKDKPSTTGHSWDGVEEYNTPAPRWWLIVWMVCIIYAIGYWFLYPTWPIPGGNTKGSKNWTQQSQLKESQDEIAERQNVYLNKFNQASFAKINQDKELMEFAINGGKAAFQNNCAMCHGTGAAGQKGYPNLNDDDWLWGGKVEDIYTTLLYGIRSGHDKARQSQMPSFGLDKILTKAEIEKVADYVLAFSNGQDQSKMTEGKTIFENNCVACHTASGKGNREVGAPNLTDKIWLYGGKKEDLLYTIYYARAGVMPYWSSRLDNATIRQLSIYVHSLGGGE